MGAPNKLKHEVKSMLARNTVSGDIVLTVIYIVVFQLLNRRSSFLGWAYVVVL